MSAMLRAQFAGRIVASTAFNLLFPRGEWHGENLRPIGGSIVIDDAMLSEMVANWRAAGAPSLPVYKTHAHLDEDASALERAELSKAYGYLTDFRVTAAGLEAKTEWTPEGKRMIDEGEFAFWSPEWQPNHVDRRTGDLKGWWLSATALCSNPFFDSMPQLAAQLPLNSMPRVAASVSVAPTHQPETKETNMKPEFLKRMKAALKMAEECSDEEMVAACEKMAAGMGMYASAVVSTESLTAAVKSAVEPLEGKLTAAQTEVNTLKAALLERDVTALIDGAKLAGKPVESLRVHIVAAASRDMAEAKALVDALPVVLSTKEKGHGNAGDAAVDAATLQASASKEYLEKLNAYQKETGLNTVSATRSFNRDNAELAKRAFTNPR
jgi:phage I-like protein